MAKLHTGHLILGTGAILGLSALVAAPAVASRDDGPVCFPIRATISTTFTAEGCTSPVGLCTNGVVRSSFGPFSGTSHFEASGLGGEPMGEQSIVSPPAEPATTWSYSGVLTLETRVGTVTFRDIGVLDTAQGTFTELNRPVSGTGTFDGVTGNVFIAGYVKDDASGFDGQITGELCVPR
jgi:hypothetical protein